MKLKLKLFSDFPLILALEIWDIDFSTELYKPKLHNHSIRLDVNYNDCKWWGVEGLSKMTGFDCFYIVRVFVC